MKEVCETTQKELVDLLEKQTAQNEQVAQLTEKLKVTTNTSYVFLLFLLKLPHLTEVCLYLLLYVEFSSSLFSVIYYFDIMVHPRYCKE